jgi:hypothetical protein
LLIVISLPLRGDFSRSDSEPAGATRIVEELGVICKAISPIVPLELEWPTLDDRAMHRMHQNLRNSRAYFPIRHGLLADSQFQPSFIATYPPQLGEFSNRKALALPPGYEL